MHLKRPGSSIASLDDADVVHRYEQLLKTGDTTGILGLFAPESVAEWNDKPSLVTREEKQEAYEALFKLARFSTVFGYAGIDVTGDTAARCRTNHVSAESRSLAL